MPGRNIIKNYDTDSYYHVYNRGVEKRKIFIDDQDYSVFISLLKRYLDTSEEYDSRGRLYIKLGEGVEMVAFCLMSNHFHLLLYQIEIGFVTELLRAVCSSYSTYFNRKYKRVGSLFQGSFKAVLINNDQYLQYISRYIHRNPVDYLNWEWSSLNFWLNKKSASWLNPSRLNQMNNEQYLQYINDDTSYEDSITEITPLIF